MRPVESRRWSAAAATLGFAVGALLVLTPPLGALPLAISPHVTPPGDLPGASLIEPAGTGWSLTPPSTWCTVTPLPTAGTTVPGGNNTSSTSGGFEYTCSTAGAATVLLNVTAPSTLSGTLAISGPFTIWILPSVWSCELAVQLTGAVHPCAPPYDPPPWPSWNATYSAAEAVNLSGLPLDVTGTVGILPPAVWLLLIVDDQQSNETATAISPVYLLTD